MRAEGEGQAVIVEFSFAYRVAIGPSKFFHPSKILSVRLNNANKIMQIALFTCRCFPTLEQVQKQARWATTRFCITFTWSAGFINYWRKLEYSWSSVSEKNFLFYDLVTINCWYYCIEIYSKTVPLYLFPRNVTLLASLLILSLLYL